LVEEELKMFYADLMRSEAMHYTMFLQFARKIGEGRIDVDKKWEDFLEYEAEVIQMFGDKEEIHG